MGVCNASTSTIPHIMLVGIENSGKTYFWYSRWKTIITPGNDQVRTKPTNAFNFEEVEIGAFKVAIWDWAGNENWRWFWPNFYRNWNFSGVIYFIDYENKDTLSESIRVMHDLFSEEEFEDIKILIILNKTRSDKSKEKSKKGEDSSEVQEIKRTIYYDLIKQQSKSLYYFDWYETTTNEVDMEKVHTEMKTFISSFD